MSYLLPSFRRDSVISTVELWVLCMDHLPKYCAVVPRRWVSSNKRHPQIPNLLASRKIIHQGLRVTTNLRLIIIKI